MTLEQQVVSLDLAKVLAELGVKQTSYFYWISRMEGDEEVAFVADEKHWEELYEGQYGWVKISAFTVAELGEMLPTYLKYFKTEHPAGIRWYANGTNLPNQEAEYEADARAKILIYLLENNLYQL
jgi:hypothetical protein